MAHVDPTHLMELALGNGVTPDDGTLRHLAGCGPCREELRRTLRVVVAARGVRERDLPSEPPERVWRAVARDLAATDRTLAPPPPPPVPPARTSPGESRWAARRETARRVARRRLLSALAAVTRRLKG